MSFTYADILGVTEPSLNHSAAVFMHSSPTITIFIFNDTTGYLRGAAAKPGTRGRRGNAGKRHCLPT